MIKHRISNLIIPIFNFFEEPLKSGFSCMFGNRGISSYINRRNTMKSHNNIDRTLELIKKQKVITSSELAKHLKISWNTAEKCLLELALDGKIERIKKEGVNLWLRK